MSRPLKIMLVAAEASGDALGAGLAQALRARLGDDVAFVGVGGPRMAAEGVVSPFNIAELSILGWIEGLRAYGKVKRRVEQTAALADREKPDAVVLIVSEERGSMRIALGGRLGPDLNGTELREQLRVLVYDYEDLGDVPSPETPAKRVMEPQS